MAIHPAESQNNDNRWAMALTTISLVGFGLLLVVLLTGLSVSISPRLLWGLIALAMSLLLVGLGIGATGKWYGVIVEKSRNRASLSRLQITLWTIMIVSAFLSMAFTRALRSVPAPSAEDVAACKAEYVASTYNISLVDLEEQYNTGDGESSHAGTGGNPAPEVTLEEALKEAKDECIPQVLNINFPQELLLVLGISTASFAGSSLIKNNKRNKPSLELKRLRNTVETAEQELDAKIKQYNEAQNRQRASDVVLAREREKLAETPEPRDGDEPSEEREKAKERVRSADIAWETAREMANNANAEKEAAKQALTKVQEELAARKDQGLLAVADEPRLTDIFYGDQEGNAPYIDLGKVQMFFFTIAILVAYGVALGELLNNTGLVLAPLGVDFPAFSSSMTTLLGISHAGYLTVKTPDRPQTAEPA